MLVFHYHCLSKPKAPEREKQNHIDYTQVIVARPNTQEVISKHFHNTGVSSPFPSSSCLFF